MWDSPFKEIKPTTYLCEEKLNILNLFYLFTKTYLRI